MSLKIRVAAIVALFFFVNTQTLSAPVANNDVVSMADGQWLYIEVLNNDSGLEDKPIEVTILSQPDDATASPMIINDDHLIMVYTNRGASGIDSFVYQVSDAEGNKSIATVQLDVSCTTQCGTLSLGWNTGPVAVMGYRVFFGPTPSTATSQVFDTSATSVTFNAISMLSLSKGDPMCFRVKSYNAVSESDLSDAVCGIL